MKMVSYKIVRAPNRDLCVAYGKQYFPTNIAAMILKGIKQTAKKYYGKSVSNAIFAFPRETTDVQYKEIMNVGLMARLHLLLLINEPIAAISYGLINKEGLIAICDLSDRNFDVSILRISDGDLNIVGKHDPFLGGEDFDNVIVEYLVSEIKCIHGIDATI
ncbi:hypothetical protein IFM89_021127 [Coptis chinensis]|uniref:Heat shock protein 70 n=1 Tax=Coptis chinensis TaxID=261450 RepID=A0A835I461_9MAGN|nr:hypothetical protein IFM89_021127 [Coptis chinensis]